MILLAGGFKFARRFVAASHGNWNRGQPAATQGGIRCSLECFQFHLVEQKYVGETYIACGPVKNGPRI